LLNEWFVWITYMSLGETQGSNTMYIVEIEERDSGEKEYKAFIKSSDGAIDACNDNAAVTGPRLSTKFSAEGRSLVCPKRGSKKDSPTRVGCGGSTASR
jgi:hypothetical protein